MKLARRLWLLVFPVLVVGTLLAVLAVYTVEKRLLLEGESAHLNQYGNHLVATFTAYSNLSESYLESLLRSSSLQDVLLAKDEFIMSYTMENNLTQMLHGLSKLRLDKFSLVLLNADGSVKYFFEDSNDPFSEPSAVVTRQVAEMFERRQSLGRKIVMGELVSTMVHTKVLDPRTLRVPVAERWSNGVAVAMHFGMSSLDEIIEEGELNGYRVELIPSEHLESAVQREGAIHYEQHLMDGYWLHVNYDPQMVSQKLNDLLVNIVVLALVSVVVVAYVLIKLIELYVTHPISKLEKNVLAADRGEKLPEPSLARDEVSSLERSFHRLYTQQKAASEVFQTMAETDHLTRLLNRRQFNKTLVNVLERIDSDKKVALLFIDLDNFKYVNDNYGHDIGDHLLVAFSESLKNQFRPTDMVVGLSNTLSRLGGDEFCVLLYDFDQDAVAQKAAERIIALFDDGFTTQDGTFPVSASIGIALYPRDASSAEELMTNADASMYQAKKAGKNQFAFYSHELAEQNQRYLQLEVALKNVDYSEFSMVYMPQVEAVSGRMSGVEALIRWRSPTLGFVSPAEFIPIAEASGMFRELDLWVIRRVLRDRRRLREIAGDEVRVSINISAAQLNSGSFFLDLMLIMQTMNESPKGLVLEITETFAAHRSEVLVSNLNLLKQAGFELALDDFGTGYSSMVQLVDYPIDEIKIDKYMIDNLAGNTLAMLRAMATFFSSTGYRVTAEGVETPEQEALLLQMDIDTLQGYLYSKPVSLDELAEQVSLGGVVAGTKKPA
ncbi:MAG: GGDEF domain-containing phosphodiesterase [Candidatus Pelagadaptatus aseana]|uniref:putative bifunctional diguanylate cyclase/phosphodiesterase n=1 Tax=Candidatus Pelagadaptatus aseana TaxID=3120508 RepID=UPI0039B13667